MSRITRSASARLGHLFDEGGHHLVAEFLLDRLAAVVVGKGPAAVAHRADIGKGNLQRLGLGAGAGADAAGLGARAGGASSFLPQPTRAAAAATADRAANFQQGTFLQISHVSSFMAGLGEKRL
jgi:hypothetical protein